MTKSYSLDLRQRVARLVEAGHSCHAAARYFDVSVAFVVRLMAAYRATGSLAAKPEGGWRYSKLDPHREFLIGRMTEKDDLTMSQLASELRALGTKVTPASVSRWFIRNGYRFKKTRTAKLTGRPGVQEPPGRWQDHAESGCAMFALGDPSQDVVASSSSVPGSLLPIRLPSEPARVWQWRRSAEPSRAGPHRVLPSCAPSRAAHDSAASRTDVRDRCWSAAGRAPHRCGTAQSGSCASPSGNDREPRPAFRPCFGAAASLRAPHQPAAAPGRRSRPAGCRANGLRRERTGRPAPRPATRQPCAPERARSTGASA